MKDGDANINFGAVIDETLRDMLKITIIATGAAGPQYSNFRPLTMFG